MSKLFDVTLETLANADQLQLLNYLDTVEVPQEAFLEYLENFDYEEINRIYNEATDTTNHIPMSRFTHLKAENVVTPEKWDSTNKNRYFDRGSMAIGAQHVAILLCDDDYQPLLLSGKTKIGLPSKKSLYQILADKIYRCLKISAKYMNKKNCRIIWIIMVTLLAKDDHISYFEKHDYFGMNKEDVYFVKQEVVPCYNLQGKILLADKQHIALTSNGSGGILTALSTSGMLNTLQSKHVKYLFTCTCSNLMLNMLDPLFLGYCIENHSEFGISVLKKREALKLGVIGKLDTKLCVISSNFKQGSVLDGYYDTGNYFITVDFINKFVNGNEQIKYKTINTKVPIRNDNGEVVYHDGVCAKKSLSDLLSIAKVASPFEISPRYMLHIELYENKIIANIIDSFFNICKEQLTRCGAIIEGKQFEISMRLFDDLDEITNIVGNRKLKAPYVLFDVSEEDTNLKSESSGGLRKSGLGKSLQNLFRTKSFSGNL